MKAQQAQAPPRRWWLPPVLASAAFGAVMAVVTGFADSKGWMRYADAKPLLALGLAGWTIAWVGSGYMMNRGIGRRVTLWRAARSGLVSLVGVALGVVALVLAVYIGLEINCGSGYECPF